MNRALQYMFVIIYAMQFLSASAQQILYQDIFHGGVTAGGFSTGLGAGSGEVEFYIEPGSTIRRAILLAYSTLNANEQLSINDLDVVFHSANRIASFSHTNTFYTPIHLHFVDITDWMIISFNSTMVFDVAVQPGMPFEGVFAPFLIITYENPNLPVVCTSIVGNQLNLTGNEQYEVTDLNTINADWPVGFSLYTDRSGSNFMEDKMVYFNSNLLGIVGGSDNVNLATFAGVKGHFYYQNNQLFGLDDDVPNNTMAGTDGLADVSGYLENNATNCSFQMLHINYPNQPVTHTNANLAYTFAYTTPCQPFETTLTDDVELCRGETAHLLATGGTSTGSAPAYEWLPQEDLSCYNCPNPVFSGDSSKIYTVRIWNTDSCSKVLPVKVMVLDAPHNINLSTCPATCSENNGVLQIGGVSGGKPPYSYNFAGSWITNPTAPIFSQFSAGEYTLTVRDQNQCFYSQPFTIEEVIPAIAAFSANPQEGTEPLTVQFNNQSSGATDYEWTVEGETFTTFQHQHTFDSAGSYPVQLISWYNEPHCADTTTATIIVHPDYTHSLFLPTLYDNHSVAYTIQTTNVAHIHYELFNTIGQRLYHVEQEVNNGPTELWYGGSYATGYYFFRIRYTNIEGQQFEERGKVLVVR